MSKTDRELLAEGLRLKGIKDEKVLKAISKIKREKFIPIAFRNRAYEDIALPIGYDQTISQPYTVAKMTEELQVKKGDKVLEIGTGSGYQAAILFEMGAKVFSIERRYEIFRNTQKLFDSLGIRVNTKCGDGTLGWDEFAPFNGIIVTAGSPDVPEALKKQLAVNGKLVIPVGGRYTQTLKVLTKISEEEFEVKDIPQFAFVPLIGRDGWEEK